jgi:hypothetical protein
MVPSALQVSIRTRMQKIAGTGIQQKMLVQVGGLSPSHVLFFWFLCAG